MTAITGDQQFNMNSEQQCRFDMPVSVNGNVRTIFSPLTTWIFNSTFSVIKNSDLEYSPCYMVDPVKWKKSALLF